MEYGAEVPLSSTIMQLIGQWYGAVIFRFVYSNVGLYYAQRGFHEQTDH